MFLKEPIQTKAYQCKVLKDDLARLVSELDDLKKEIRVCIQHRYPGYGC